MTTTAKKTATPDKAKRLIDFPDYAAALNKLNELRGQLNEAERDKDACLAGINNTATQGSRNRLEEQAEQLLESGNIPPRQDRIQSARQAFDDATHKVAILQSAVNLQARRVESLRTRHSKTICQQEEKIYRDTVRRAINASVEQSRAWKEIQDLRDSLAADGVMISYLPQAPPFLHKMGRWDDPNANVHLMLNDAINGYFVTDEFNDRPKVSPERLPPGRHRSAGPDGIRVFDVAVDGTKKLIEHLQPPERGEWS